MNTRWILVMGISVVALSPAIAGLVSRENVKTEPAAVRQPAVEAPASGQPRESTPDKSSGSETTKQSRGSMSDEKAILGRLVTELQRSPRSFIYLRSAGFTESDAEFEQLISKNNAIFRRTRIVRRDDQGNRQIPGWPGVTLTPEYKGQRR
jgi:hypothetical protein